LNCSFILFKKLGGEFSQEIPEHEVKSLIKELAGGRDDASQDFTVGFIRAVGKVTHVKG
jgi:hypothetical protein